MRALAKTHLPAPVLQGCRIARSLFDFDFWHLRAFSAARLLRLRSKYKGERCFIIGNGPSLNNTDLTLLKNEITFGLNRIYLLFEKMGFHTTYHVCVNPLVIEQCARDIEALPMPRFISWHCRKIVQRSPGMMFIGDPYDRPLGFSKTPITRIWEGSTVTYVAMQLAYYLGFKQVVLVGVDHRFVTEGPPHAAVTSAGGDPDHFDPAYFGNGFRWNLPDLNTSEAAYRLAKSTFEADGREIIDATVGGRLSVFRRVPYESLFDRSIRS